MGLKFQNTTLNILWKLVLYFLLLWSFWYEQKQLNEIYALILNHTYMKLVPESVH